MGGILGEGGEGEERGGRKAGKGVVLVPAIQKGVFNTRIHCLQLSSTPKTPPHPFQAQNLRGSGEGGGVVQLASVLVPSKKGVVPRFEF